MAGLYTQRVRAGALLCAALLVAPAQRADAQDDALAQIEKAQETLFDRISPSVVFIATDNGFGSGFFVTDDGIVLTNAHVVAGRSSVRVVLTDGRSLPGTVLETAPGNVDLALVKVAVTRAPALRLSETHDLRVGAWIASVGHGRGGIWSFNTGMVSNIYPDGADRPVFQTQIPLNPGNSGGPVVDRKGRVVGVVTAALRDSQSINFAIRSEVALRTFSRLAGACACIVVTLPAGVPLFVDGKLAGTGPRVVLAAEAREYEIFAVVGGVMKKKRVRYPESQAVHIE